MPECIPIKIIERLSIYRRILKIELERHREYIFSHELAGLTQRKPAQIRRDLMVLDILANPQKGYLVKDLIRQISKKLDSPQKQIIALAGVGNIGRALIKFFEKSSLNLEIKVAFDTDNKKIGKKIGNCRCYQVDRMARIISDKRITIGLIAVPEKQAQAAADMLIAAGVKSLINIAPVLIKTPDNIYVEYLDFTTSFEKAAYYAKHRLKY